MSALAASSAEASEGGLSATAPPPTDAPPTATPPAAAPTTGAPSRVVFPIRGPHRYWAGMGDGRGHQGVDVGARCGTPLVAAQAGRVLFAKYHARAGNYVVIDVTGSPFDHAYMHLSEPAIVELGQHVAAGQRIGSVGATGNASGCHLHFEVWEGPYYRGGAPIDPMPFLTSWDRARRAARS